MNPPREKMFHELVPIFFRSSGVYIKKAFPPLFCQEKDW
jgi:hypothetical protein